MEGRTFYVLTDHKPLTHALSSRFDKHSPRQIRQLDFISQFTSDIRHIKREHNTAADALSRIAIIQEHTSPTIDFQAIAAAQTKDHELSLFMSGQSKCNLTLKPVPLSTADTTIICDMSTGTPRPFLPSQFRRLVFDKLHSLSHPGVRATRRLLTARFVWPNINKDVTHWSRTCQQCQRSKVHRHTTTPLSTFASPDARFDHVHVDLVGPLPPSEGFTYLLVLTDLLAGQRSFH